METLKQLTSTEPPQWLAPSESLSETAREACSFLFASLNSHAPKSPFDRLLVEGFDAEQIWQQIDLQSQPLLPALRRQVAFFQNNPNEIGKLPMADADEEDEDRDVADLAGFGSAEDEDDEGDEDDDGDEDEDEDDEGDGDEDEDDEGDEDEGDIEKEKEEGMQLGGVDDKFFKMKELEEYLEEDEAREYGMDSDKVEKKKKKKKSEDEDDESDGGEEDDDEVDIFGFGEGDEEDEHGADARYEDFFNDKKRKGLDKKSKWSENSSGSDGEEDDNKGKGGLSTHEKQLRQKQVEIDKMEKANLEPKFWTMQGEVTASKRPVNSALEVDLDFEHNVQPPPVITEEISASLEVMIKKRIEKGLFDDIQKASRLTPKAPKENKEIDDNKSKKGLAEIYEEEYVQKTNPFSTPMSFSDELKKEASVLFKKLCSQLDALSHFHFAPKPVIEDMSIQTNVPALAMEEIAPQAVSDAAMLAPEEIFSGKGDIKEEAELTKEDRNRRRAKKKRKFKAEEAKRTAKKPKTTTAVDHSEDDQS